MADVSSGTPEQVNSGHMLAGHAAHAGQAAAACQHIMFRGQPAWRVSLPQGDAVQVSQQGAQVLSWVSGGRERLFLSPLAHVDGQSAIRGGVPVCFPQFNQRGTLAKHGFARNLMWRVQGETVVAPGATEVSWCLTDSAATRHVWPCRFAAVLQLTLSPGGLLITLSVTHVGAPDDATADLAFTGALHTYLAVDDVERATLSGLGGQPEWNAVTDARGQAADTLRFGDEFDRVYTSAGGALCLADGDHRLLISQSDSFADTVVWNPGAALGAQLADMPENGYRHMLCVEAAAVHTAITVPLGATWQGWQRLQVA